MHAASRCKATGVPLWYHRRRRRLCAGVWALSHVKARVPASRLAPYFFGLSSLLPWLAALFRENGAAAQARGLRGLFGGGRTTSTCQPPPSPARGETSLDEAMLGMSQREVVGGGGRRFVRARKANALEVTGKGLL